MCAVQVSVLLYHGTQPERAKLLKQIRRPQGPLNMCPVVVTSFEISMIDRKFLQVLAFYWHFLVELIYRFIFKLICSCMRCNKTVIAP